MKDIMNRYPPLVVAGSECSEPVTSTDFYPTILQLAGLPLMPEQHADGISILPLLKDSSAKLGRDAIYWHYPHYSPQGGTPSGAIREGDMKLIEFFEDDHVELYNLKDDLSETTDLATEDPELAERLHEKLKAWRIEVDAKLPIVNPNYGKGSPARPSRSRVQVKPKHIDYSDEWPGFDTLKNVRIEKSDFGLKLTSNTEAWAVQKLDEPLRRAIFKVQTRPRAAFPSNAALVFGDEATDGGLVRCCLLIGGSQAAIYERAYPSSDRVEGHLVPRDDRTYEIAVEVDLDAGTVVMKTGDTTLTKRLSRKLEAIKYVGHGNIWTEAEFSPITVEKR